MTAYELRDVLAGLMQRHGHDIEVEMAIESSSETFPVESVSYDETTGCVVIA
jgi:hypothetical protein